MGGARAGIRPRGVAAAMLSGVGDIACEHAQPLAARQQILPGRADRPARKVILNRLIEVLPIEARRSAASTAASPGLLRVLGDPRLAAALRQMHEHPARPWTIAQLAAAAALSRSAFFERVTPTVGTAPMDYLLS